MGTNNKKEKQQGQNVPDAQEVQKDAQGGAAPVKENEDIFANMTEDDLQRFRSYIAAHNIVCLHELDELNESGELFGSSPDGLMEKAEAVRKTKDTDTPVRVELIEGVAKNYDNFVHPFNGENRQREFAELLPCLYLIFQVTTKETPLLAFSFESFDDSDGRPPLWWDIVEAARDLRNRVETRALNGEETDSNTPSAPTTGDAIDAVRRLTAKIIDRASYPVDKVNGNVWNLLATADKSGQLSFSFDVTKKTGKQKKPSKPAIIGCSLNFDEMAEKLTITKQLTPYDKRVYVAAAAIYNAGNDCMTATQIYKAMGCAGRPNSSMLAQIRESINKMRLTRIYLDNEQEASVYKKQVSFKYEGTLLPSESVTVSMNGELVENAIHLFREPPLMSFARERGQITTIPIEVLQDPLTKNSKGFMISDYLIERIAREKRKLAEDIKAQKRQRKPVEKKRDITLLFDTIYNHCNITTTKEKQRTHEKILKCVRYYQEIGYITDCTTKDNMTPKEKIIITISA